MYIYKKKKNFNAVEGVSDIGIYLEETSADRAITLRLTDLHSHVCKHTLDFKTVLKVMREFYMPLTCYWSNLINAKKYSELRVTADKSRNDYHHSKKTWTAGS